jgi:hypothetical protein
MPKITYFAVLPFSRDADSDFLPEAAIDVPSATEARATAPRMGGRGPGCRRFQ